MKSLTRAYFAGAAAIGVATAAAAACLTPLFAPAAAAGATTFNPMSVTFVSLRTGWALGSYPCSGAGSCLELLGTANSGASWSAKSLPSGLLADADRKVNGRALLRYASSPALNVRFANLLDGWIYGNLPGTGGVPEAVLWSTHNGGASWSQLHPFAGSTVGFPLFDLEAMGTTVYMMGVGANLRVVVESSPVGTDSWHTDATPRLSLPAGGAEPSGSFVFQGGRGWLVEGNDRGVTGSAILQGNGQWVAWTPPCMSVGDSFTVPAAANASDLVAVCVMGGFAFPLSKSAPPGATLGSTWLYLSSNGGGSFHAGPELSKSYSGAQYGGVLASPSPGVVIAGRSGATAELVASFDNGHDWADVATGQFFYLGFTSPSQGVGLVTPSYAATRTSMVMTFDGGHHWSTVSF